MEESANRLRSDKKRKPPRSAWKPGQSGNPQGPPKRGESWTETIKRVGNMTPAEIILELGSNPLSAAFAKMPLHVQMKNLVTMRMYAASMFEPQAALVNALIDRDEGKVADRVNLSVDRPAPIEINVIDQRPLQPAEVPPLLPEPKPEPQHGDSALPEASPDSSQPKA